MTGPPLVLTRWQILTFRRQVGALNERLPPGPDSLRQAAWAGLQDSMPRAALLSIHARVSGTTPSTWEDTSLLQLWGPRFSTYVVAAQDLPVFSIGRQPGGAGARRGEDIAERLHSLLAGGRMTDRDAAQALGDIGNAIRYAAPTGRVVIRWEGARAPMVWTVPRAKITPAEARLELARRYVHIFGPTTVDSFSEWAGIGPRDGVAAFEALQTELMAVRTPIGDRWMLASDEPAVRAAPAPPASARLLPNGDAYWLLQGADRELMVPDASQRAELWTPRVWPAALLAPSARGGPDRALARALARGTCRAGGGSSGAAASLLGQMVVRWDSSQP